MKKKVLSISLSFVLLFSAFISNSVLAAGNDPIKLVGANVPASAGGIDYPLSISEDGLTVHEGWVRASEGKNTDAGGKFYWETHVDGDFQNSVTKQGQVNVLIDEPLDGNHNGGYCSIGSILGSQPVFSDFIDKRGVAAFKQGDTVGAALDLDNKEINFYDNGEFVGQAPLNKEAGHTFFAHFNSGVDMTVNFGRKAFAYPMPAGYVPYDYVSGINDPISSGGDNPGEETTDPTDNGSGSPEIANQLYIVLEVGEKLRASVSENLEDSKNYNWGSENSSVASVDEEGMIVASSVGSTKITGQKKDGSLNGQILVKVVQTGHSSAERVTADMDKGQSVRLFISDEAAGVKWHTNDETVVKVDESGKITAVGNGLALVSAEFNGKTYGTYIRVR